MLRHVLGDAARLQPHLPPKVCCFRQVLRLCDNIASHRIRRGRGRGGEATRFVYRHVFEEVYETRSKAAPTDPTTLCHRHRQHICNNGASCAQQSKRNAANALILSGVEDDQCRRIPRVGDVEEMVSSPHRGE
tara:strand:- start:7 stop:405 length:399 start_codon:yes stop_codon:yes gene_type:complete